MAYVSAWLYTLISVTGIAHVSCMLSLLFISPCFDRYELIMMELPSKPYLVTIMSVAYSTQFVSNYESLQLRMLLTISLRYVYFLILVSYNNKFGTSMLSIGLVVTELCCHKINMNAKEKHIIQRILKYNGDMSVRVFL